GSGKTLAFGIPVIQRIMTMKSASATRAAAVKQLADIDDDDNDDVGDQADAIESADEDADQSPDEAELAECGWADGDIEEDLGLLAGSLTELGPDGQPTLAYSAENVFEDDGSAKKRGGRLYCLVLTPTRELAKQVAAHLQRVAVHTGVTVAAVLGGLSAQRQERLLAGAPDIVVGTPAAGSPSIGGLASLPMLVLDEADRLAEPPGHFAEMRALLERINANATTTIQRRLQLSGLLVAGRPADQRRSKLKRMRPAGPGRSGRCAGRTGRNAVGGLTEFRLDCEAKDKDLYLWWLLRSRRGRTLVFCASKRHGQAAAPRLLTLLRCPNCRPLHSDMQQRQRLKSLDRFSANPDSVLLATDVAASRIGHPRSGARGALSGAEGVGALPAQVRPNRSGQPQRHPQSPWCRLRRRGPLRRLLRGLGRGSDGDVDDAGESRQSGSMSAPPSQEQLAGSGRPSTACSGSTLNGCGSNGQLRARARSRPARTGRSPGRRRRRLNCPITWLSWIKPTRKWLDSARSRLNQLLNELDSTNNNNSSNSACGAATAAGGLPRSLRYPMLCPAITTSRGTSYLATKLLSLLHLLPRRMSTSQGEDGSSAGAATAARQQLLAAVEQHCSNSPCPPGRCLALTGAEGGSHFDRVEPGVTSWERRRWYLLRELLRFQPDILCLNEVDILRLFVGESRSSWLQGLLSARSPRSPCLSFPGNFGPDGTA
uniref:ATP-dependent RNA helicase n=1 Tax=Macrostomum lignano TaxID=282301 RepID=A0A1I8FJG4_9PLAT